LGIGEAPVLETIDSMAHSSKPSKTKKQTSRSTWKCAYSLNNARRPLSGSEEELAAAIRRGADLRIYTEFGHNEHLDTTSKNPELIREVADFRVTYLAENAGLLESSICGSRLAWGEESCLAS
jgi:hypothetical protein